MSSKSSLRRLLVLIGIGLAGHASAQITLYDGAGFRGRSFSTSESVADLGRSGFNDRASSLVVDAGQWQVFDDTGFAGRCIVVLTGRYQSLRSIGLDNRISSILPIAAAIGQTDTPPPQSVDYRSRLGERLTKTPVTSVQAVMGPAEQRC